MMAKGKRMTETLATTAPPSARARTPSVFTTAVGADIIAHRANGAPLRVAVEAVGIAWDTAREWITRGRRWNEGERDNIGDATYADFSAELDSASASHKTTLWSRVTAATAATASGDQVRAGNLALHVLDHIARASMVNDERRLMKARADVEENRAAGTHVEHVAMTGPSDREQLLAEARGILAELEGGSADELGGEAPATH